MGRTPSPTLRRRRLGAELRRLREAAGLTGEQVIDRVGWASASKLSRLENGRSRPYLRDVGDHLFQVSGEFQRQIDDLGALTQTYFNANSDRLNVVATRLTIGGTIFVVWTVVTGFFGQNFGWLVDRIDSREDFFVFGVGALLVPSVILLSLFWVKRDDWF